jgi:hypothetical protein
LPQILFILIGYRQCLARLAFARFCEHYQKRYQKLWQPETFEPLTFAPSPFKVREEEESHHTPHATATTVWIPSIVHHNFEDFSFWLCVSDLESLFSHY